jgi:hypothetical protein
MGQSQAEGNDRGVSWSSPAPERVFLALILLTELWLFTGAFQKFFTHDSLFYMINAPDSWEQFRPQMMAPSAEKSFRPLNLGLVALLRPYLGTDPRPYHWVPILFHMINTCIFYILAKRLLPSLPAALAATAFWGLHSVAGWVTYDITYLSDFLLAFLLLVSIVWAVDGNRLKSRPRIILSLFAFALTLTTKEAATTFPVAIWISLSLADLKRSEDPPSWRRARSAFRKTIPLASLYFLIACAFAGLFTYWFLTGALYAQGANAAYNINPWANLLAKAKYGYWSLNLPDALSIPNAHRNYVVAMGLMAAVCAVWLLDILRRRGKLSVIEWSGVVWLAGLNIPALLLSHRLAKWYLYIPLFGLALAFGVLIENLRTRFPFIIPRFRGLVLAGLMCVPIVFASHVQTRSYIADSDSSYQSDLLQTCLNDFKADHPELPPQATLYFLPAFEEGVSDLLSAPPIDRGGLFQIYYPGTRIQALFAHKGHRLPENLDARSDVFVLQYLDRHLYDVTKHFKSTGKMTLFLMPTSEGESAPLLKKMPAGGRELYNHYVQLLIADEGALLPDDYLARRDLWFLQYQDGHFNDVTPLISKEAPETMLLLPTLDGKVPPLRLLRDIPGTAARLEQSRVRLASPADLARLPDDYLRRPDVTIFQYLNGYFYDVSHHFKTRGRMSLFLLPTFEGKVPQVLRRDNACRNQVCTSPVDTQFADDGARLPQDYFQRADLWLLQYLNGRFSDVTEHYFGRHRDGATRIVRSLENVQYSVNRAERYPNYDRFETPTGAPVFFQTAEKEILTQIGGSTVVIPLQEIPGDSNLQFDVSWMYDAGDGGWDEAVLRTDAKETIVFREHMRPNPKISTLLWKAVKVDLRPFANRKVDLILKCYNNPGGNTIADWLNWRDLSISLSK